MQIHEIFMNKTLHIHHENVHEQDIAYYSKSNHKCRPTVLYLYICSVYTLANYIIYYFINFPLANVVGQFHEERDEVKIKKYGFFHCKLIVLTQTVLHVLGKNVFILFANLFS